MNLNRLVLLLMLVVISLGYAGAKKGDTGPAIVGYDPEMSERVAIDGFIDYEDVEYPSSFADPVTGITVYWGYDDSLIYIGLEAPGKGWLAIGLGSASMDKSNMFIGYYTEDSTLLVNYIGTGHTHRPVTGAQLLEDWEIDYDDELNATAVEFAYPLRWTGIKGTAVSQLTPGETYPFILARNPKSPSFAAKHGKRASYQFQLQPKPAPGDSTRTNPPAREQQQ